MTGFATRSGRDFARGVAIACVSDPAELETLQREDPAIRSGRGFRYETLPMPAAIMRGHGEIKR